MLTDTKLRAMKPRGKLYRLADAAGLCVEVHPSGARYWRFRYRFAGKAKMLSLGIYPKVSLTEARQRREDARRLLGCGIDPSAQRQQDKLTAHFAVANGFEAVAREWLAGRGKLAETTRAKTAWMLETHVFPWIGKRPVREITAPELLAVLRRLESLDKLETAQRVKQICGQVFRYAIATGRADRDPAADLRGALKTKKTRHHAAITDPAKVGELRKAEWSEFDLDNAEWRIPAERMKMRALHIVPLSEQAVAILRELQPLTSHGRYVFPSIRSPRDPMSENTVTAALRRLGYTGDEMTGHG